MDPATMRRRCWMIVLVGMMSYFNPERALGAPQREGERCRCDDNDAEERRKTEREVERGGGGGMRR